MSAEVKYCTKKVMNTKVNCQKNMDKLRPWKMFYPAKNVPNIRASNSCSLRVKVVGSNQLLF